MYVCTPCTVVSLSKTFVNVNTPPLTWGCNFDARLVSNNAKVSFNKETEKARLPDDSIQSVQAWSTASRPIQSVRSDHRWLVYIRSLVLIPQLSALSVIARSWALKFSPSSASVSVHKFSSCTLRVNVFRSLSCSQSIRQRICRRTVTLYFNLHMNSQILVHRSQG